MDLSLEREVCYLISFRTVSAQDFPSGRLAKTLCSQCKGPGFNSWSEKWSEVKVPQSCLALWDPMDYTVHGILQVRILEWVAFPFSRGSSQPRDQTQASHIAGRFFTSWTIWEAPYTYGHSSYQEEQASSESVGLIWFWQYNCLRLP